MNNKQKLLIIGASGHGKVVADIALETGEWDEIAFLDDDENLKETMGFNVIGNTNDISHYVKEYSMIVGIGNNAIREQFFDQLDKLGANISTLVHPTAIIGGEVKIGRGTVVMAGAIINCCTNIGEGCIINTGATIDHDNNIADFVHVSPGAHLAGAVSVGQQSWLGIGSCVTNNITIIERSTIGAGAVVIDDITVSGTYIGVPAK